MVSSVDYNSLANELESSVMKIVSEGQWTPMKTKKGIEISYKQSSNFEGNMYKFVTHLDIASKHVFAVMKPPSTTAEKMSWDTSIAHYEKIKSISEDLMIARILTKSAIFGVISPREFIDIFYTKSYPNFLSRPNYGKTNWIFAVSVSDARFPVTENYVRATNHPLGYAISEDIRNPNKSYLEMYVNTDVGGMIPTSLVEKALPSQQIEYIESIVREAKRRIS